MWQIWFTLPITDSKVLKGHHILWQWTQIVIQQLVRRKLNELFNVSWNEAYLCYINTHRGLLQCPICHAIYGNTDTRFNFGYQQAAVIQRLNTSSAALLVATEDKDNWRANNQQRLQIKSMSVSQSKGPKYTLMFANYLLAQCCTDKSWWKLMV